MTRLSLKFLLGGIIVLGLLFAETAPLMAASATEELNLNDIRLVLGSASGKYYNLKKKVKCSKLIHPHNKYFVSGYNNDVPCDGEEKISGYWVWLQPHWYIWDEQVQGQPKEKPSAEGDK